MSDEFQQVSSWLCLRCGRAGRVEHHYALLGPSVVDEHRRRQRPPRGPWRWCAADLDDFRVKRGDGNYVALCAEVRASGVHFQGPRP